MDSIVSNSKSSILRERVKGLSNQVLKAAIFKVSCLGFKTKQAFKIIECTSRIETLKTIIFNSYQLKSFQNCGFTMENNKN